MREKERGRMNERGMGECAREREPEAEKEAERDRLRDRLRFRLERMN